MKKRENLSVLILAAGKGKRMKSSKPKVLHQIFGRPMLYYILKSAYGLNPGNVVVVVGHRKDMVKQYLHQNFPEAISADQDQQLGTAHAVRSAARLKDKMGQRVLVLSGDCPLIESKTLKLLLQKMDKTGSSSAILSTILPDPTGYGRIIKDSRGKVLKVVEQKDATTQQKMIKEINTSIYSFNRDKLFLHVENIDSDNSQNEYYLTDVVEKLVEAGDRVTSLKLKDFIQVMGVNDRKQLAEVEKILKQKINQKFMEQGVSIKDPENTHIQDTVEIEKDTTIEPYCFITGITTIGTGCRIGPFCQINDAAVGRDTIINNSVVNGSRIGENNRIGPYSSLGPETETKKGQCIGNYLNQG